MKRQADMDRWLNDAINKASELLAPGYQIEITINSEEASMELFDPDAECVSGEWDGDSHTLDALCDASWELKSQKDDAK